MRRLTNLIEGDACCSPDTFALEGVLLPVIACDRLVDCCTTHNTLRDVFNTPTKHKNFSTGRNNTGGVGLWLVILALLYVVHACFLPRAWKEARNQILKWL